MHSAMHTAKETILSQATREFVASLRSRSSASRARRYSMPLWISRSVQAEQGRVVSGGGEEPGAPY